MKKRKYLLSLKSLEKKSKASLLRLIMKHLKTTSKARLVKIAWEINKSKLPKLNVLFSKRKTLKNYEKMRKKSMNKRVRELKALGYKERKTKRKFSPKQLAAQRLFAKRARAGTLRRKR